MSLKARVEKLREQVQASATPDAVPVVFPGDPVPESGPYIAIQVVDSRVRDDDEAIHQ
ncbi:hypothetical protein NFL11_10710 [Citrobacter braakii]|uniref:hypothetical protein n=1 Tax=Citrobacter braakii TaxID=57706 RepID=UPI00242BA293|nr:hypothetical protein [Citrobacter braakii]WGA86203.1 hypothetical protein NFL11_10710 [Citrobacter braakii]